MSKPPQVPIAQSPPSPPSRPAPSGASAAPAAGPEPLRRSLLQLGAGAAFMGLVPSGIRSAAWAAGSDAPEK